MTRTAPVVFFDIDGTLVDHRHAERRGALAFRAAHPELWDFSEDEFADTWHETTESHIGRYFRGEIGYEEQRLERMRSLFSRVGRRPSDAEALAAFRIYVETYERSFRLFPDVIPCLDSLEGSRLGIITNGVSRPQIGKLLATGIAARFGLVVCSADVGIAKPSSRIFEVACSCMDCEPAEALYVGDQLDTDARASRDAGMSGVWLDRDGGAATDVPSLRDLRRVPELLGRKPLAALAYGT